MAANVPCDVVRGACRSGFLQTPSSSHVLNVEHVKTDNTNKRFVPTTTYHIPNLILIIITLLVLPTSDLNRDGVQTVWTNILHQDDTLLPRLHGRL